MPEYAFNTAGEIRRAFWIGWPAGFQRGKLREQYDSLIRDEYADFMDMLISDELISPELANTTLDP